MTVIAGIRDGDRVHIGGDCAGTSGSVVERRRDPKVFTAGVFVIGFTTSFRMGQLIQYDAELAAITPPTKGSKPKARRFMHEKVVPRLRAILGDGGFKKVENNVETGGTFLVAFGRHLFTIHSDFQVEDCRAEYTACGSGRSLALGAFHAMTANWKDVSAQAKLWRALAAAEEHDAYVRGPMTMVTT